MLNALKVIMIVLIIVSIFGVSLHIAKEKAESQRAEAFFGEWKEIGVKKGYETFLSVSKIGIYLNGKLISTFKTPTKNILNFKVGDKKINCNIRKDELHCPKLDHYSPIFKKKD